MNAPPDDVLARAVAAARLSPCAKSKRGATAFNFARTYNEYKAAFHNVRALGVCDGSSGCMAACATHCLHAEARLVMSWRDGDENLDVVHVKVVDGVLVAGGPPSCADCAKLLWQRKAAAVWLYETGPVWRRYPILEFLALSIKNAMKGTK